MTCPVCTKPFVSHAHIRVCKRTRHQDAFTPTAAPAIDHAEEEAHDLFSALITDGPPEPPEDYEPQD